MIIVTGASGGIGSAIVQRLADSGIETIGLTRSGESKATHNYICDVAAYSNVKNVASAIKASEFEIDGLINTAGVASMNLAIATPPEVVDHIIKVNLLGTIYCCQLFSPFMVRQRQGVIINFSTIAVPLALRAESIYVASKAGVEAFSKTFAREMSACGVRVNCIAPGPIDTELIRGVGKCQIDQLVAQQVIPKQYTPDAVCDVVDLLMDEKSSSLSGAIFHIGGV